MAAKQETRSYDITFVKHKAFKRPFSYENPEGTPQDFTGATLKWWFKPQGVLTTKGSIDVGSNQLSVVSIIDLAVGGAIYVTGAGVAGDNLRAKILGISGLLITLDTNASAAVSGVDVQHGIMLDVNGPSDQKLIVQATTTLTASLSSSATELDAVDLNRFADFDNSPQFMKIDNEIVKYKTRTLTKGKELTRGVADTVAASHSSGATVKAIGQFYAYISDEKIDGFKWTRADHRMQLQDSVGDEEPLWIGLAKFEAAAKA